jgi:simple sugar transport system permease protein
MNEAMLTGLAVTTVALAVPLILAALGEVIVEKAGIINVGIEGMMLTGAFTAFVVASESHNAFLGLAAAIGAGAALAAIFACVSLVFAADQVVVGTAINILALGLTGVIYRALQSSLPGLDAHSSFSVVALPVLSRIPIVGQAFFDQTVIGYFAFLLAPVCAFYLGATRAGLALRAIGEYPDAASVSGYRVNRVRFVSLLLGGALAAVAGAYLSIAYTSGFAQGMSGGKGFIALAVVIVGRWSPLGVLLGALLFGAASAAQFGFQAASSRIPYQIFLALPYVLTLGALMLRTGRVSAPAALGQQYRG